MPSFHDPFAGGGTLPLEAQRLGLSSYASDLNPVAVLINKALIEIPSKFQDLNPINPSFRNKNEFLNKTFKGSQGIAKDVHFYGELAHKLVSEKIEHLYPKVKITAEITEHRKIWSSLRVKSLKS